MGEVISLLDRPTYTYAEVDRFLGLPKTTARRWINGYTRAGKLYLPVLREEPLVTPHATWGEYVEMRILAGYRQEYQLPVLRDLVQHLSERFNTPYPLAHAEPYLHNSEWGIVLEDQPDADPYLVATGQRILGGPGKDLVSKAPKSHDGGGVIVAEIVPDETYPAIVTNPNFRGGRPVVQGRSVLASTLAELVDGGQSIDMLAEDYQIDPDVIQQAVEYCTAYNIAA